MQHKAPQNRAASAAARVEALKQYGILDTAAEAGFDDIVLLASRICDTPVALVSLVAGDRQWFKAKVGFPACETPLSQSVCAHAIAQDSVLVIPDLTLDNRTRDNSLVTSSPFIRFYAGALLTTPDGISIGTLCVIDVVPRPGGLFPHQLEALQALARQVMGQMELRRALIQRDEAYDEFRRHQKLLSDELQHRLKNILAVVHSVVIQSLRHATDFKDARAAVANRIAALGRAQELLFAREASGAPLASIIEGTVDLYDENTERFCIDGPALLIGPQSALSLSLIFHEMATNAIKYGALSTPNGQIVIDWRFSKGTAQEHVLISWKEIGGPRIDPPRRKGFGTQLIERALSGGTVDLDYSPTGFRCVMSVPLAILTER